MLNAKSKGIRSASLNATVIGILSQLDTVGVDGNLFINRQTGKPYTTIMKVWSRLRSKAGLPQLRIHELRHRAKSSKPPAQGAEQLSALLLRKRSLPGGLGCIQKARVLAWPRRPQRQHPELSRGTLLLLVGTK
jgi:integrase